MKMVPLTNSSLLAMVNDEDYDHISKFNWQLNGQTNYAQRCARINGKIVTILMARQIMGEPKCKVDHRDHNRLNNLRSNLRLATRSENGANRHKQAEASSSRYKGVHRLKMNGKFQARIKVHGEDKYLGTFSTELDAARAYNSAALDGYGEFALLNPV